MITHLFSRVRCCRRILLVTLCLVNAAMINAGKVLNIEFADASKPPISIALSDLGDITAEDEALCFQLKGSVLKIDNSEISLMTVSDSAAGVVSPNADGVTPRWDPEQKTLSLGKVCQIRIFDTQGRLVRVESCDSVCLSDLAGGIYMITVVNNFTIKVRV